MINRLAFACCRGRLHHRFTFEFALGSCRESPIGILRLHKVLLFTLCDPIVLRRLLVAVACLDVLAHGLIRLVVIYEHALPQVVVSVPCKCGSVIVQAVVEEAGRVHG